MTRLSYMLYRWATTLRYHAPRRLTNAGMLAAFGVMLSGAIGSDMDQSVAFQGFALLLCMLGVGILWAPFFRGRFEVARTLPRLASVGQPFRYILQVRNKSGKEHHALEVLEDLADPRPSYLEFARLVRPAAKMRTFRLAAGSRARLEQRQAAVGAATLPNLRPHGMAEAEIEVIPFRRGALRFCGVTLARPDPLGLFRGFVQISAAQTVLVLPERFPVPDLIVAGTQQYQPGGVALASSVGESEEFVALREYRPGDPQRRIHWRSWARVGRPIVKEYQDEFFVRHGLVLDTSAEEGQEAIFEAAVSVAASFACTVRTQESILDLLFVGDRAFTVASGRALGDSEQVLEILASVQPSIETGFDALQELVLRHAPLLGSCICVFVRWDETRRELVRQLRGFGLRVLTLVVIDGEPKAGLGLMNDASRVGAHFVRVGMLAQDLQALKAEPA